MNISSLQTIPIGLTAAESAESLKEVGEETGIGGAGPGGPPPITVVVAASGTGTGTHMGQF
jgi:hypothetical protein